MKRSITVLLAVFVLLGTVLTSCTNDVVVDELVSVSFEEGSARALSATLEAFDKGAYYWKYAAKKNASDTSGLNSGTTASYNESGSAWIHADVAGLGGKVSGFSQGIWDFMLFAYKDAAGTNLVYTGEAKAVTLKKGASNMVSVVVSPASSGSGTLKVGTTTLDPKLAGDAPAVSRYITVASADGSTQYTPSTGTQYTLETGRYKVTVTYKSGDIIYAEGNVIATVYPGLTTTVTGNVTELVTYAQFDATQNPNIITVTAGVDGITSETTGDSSGNLTLSESSSSPKVTATIPVAAAKNLLPQVGSAADPNATMSLALNVDTKDSTSTTVTYEIGMTKTVTVNSESTTSDVTIVSDYVTVKIQLTAGLAGVSVMHSGVAMVNSTDIADDAGHGIYSYDSVTGILTIKTKTFSPFHVSFDANTAGVAEVGGTKYATVAEAFAAATSGQTIKLLENADGAGLSLAAGSKTITLDLNGKTYTITKDAVGSSSNTATQGLHLEKGNTVTIKNGKITSVAGSGVKMLIQNYSNLTLQDVELDGSNIGAGEYTLSNNYGTVSITGSTSIKAPENGYAFDAYFWPKLSYDQVGVTVNTTGTIDGTVQVWSDDDYETYGNSITIQNGTFTGSIDFRKGNLSIVGGTFTADPRPYLADGYEAILSDGVWTVSSIPSGKVARIGSSYYESLQAAIDAAQSGDAVYLLRDITATNVIEVKTEGMNLTIDGCYHTISTTASRGLWINNDDITLALSNLSIIGSSGCERGFQVCLGTEDDFYNATVTMENCIISGISHYAINLCSYTTVNLTLNHCSISGWAAINAYGTGNIITVKDSILEGINDKSKSEWNTFATISLEGDSTNQTSMGSADYVVTIEDSKVIASETTGNKQYFLGFNNHSKNSSVEFTGCEFLIGEATDNNNIIFAYNNGTGNSLFVDGESLINN